MAHQRLVGQGAVHVQAGVSQQRYRVARPAGAQHAQVGVARGSRPSEQLLGEVRGCGHAGGVLVDVERPVEVRDVGPLGAYHRVDAHDAGIRPVVLPQQVAVQARHARARQRLAALHGVVRSEFELGEHGLAEEGTADALDGLAQVEDAFFAGLGGLLHVVAQQQFVGEGGDLGDEQRVPGRLEGLRPVGQQRVHAVAPLVRVGADAVKGVLVVQEDQRSLPVHAALVGAGALARRRVHVHGARRERLAQLLLVGRAQRRHGG